MDHNRLVWAALLATFIPIAAAQAQAVDSRDKMPLRFARPGSALRRRFELDWDEKIGDGGEWTYCITKWSIALSQDSDTVYVAERAHLVVGNLERGGSRQTGVYCDDAEGFPLPIAHVHPSGDCSPSRADLEAAKRGVPFDIIICGRGATVGYFAPKLPLQ